MHTARDTQQCLYANSATDSEETMVMATYCPKLNALRISCLGRDAWNIFESFVRSQNSFWTRTVQWLSRAAARRRRTTSASINIIVEGVRNCGRPMISWIDIIAWTGHSRDQVCYASHETAEGVDRH